MAERPNYVDLVEAEISRICDIIGEQYRDALWQALISVDKAEINEKLYGEESRG